MISNKSQVHTQTSNVLIMMPREYYLRDLSSAREMFVAAGVGTFQAVLRNIMDTFILKCIFKVTMSDSKVFMAQSRGSADDYK